MLIELTIVKLQNNSEGVQKAAIFYVERTVTVHIVLFFLKTKCFYWLVVRLQCISIPSVFCARSRQTNKTI